MLFVYILVLAFFAVTCVYQGYSFDLFFQGSVLIGIGMIIKGIYDVIIKLNGMGKVTVTSNRPIPNTKNIEANAVTRNGDANWQ